MDKWTENLMNIDWLVIFNADIQNAKEAYGLYFC